MKHKKTRIILSIALSLTMLLGIVGMTNITTIAATNKPTGGLKKSVVVEDEISEEEYNKVLADNGENQSEYFLYSKKGTSDYWKSFSQPFYTYNDKLTSEQKKLYDDLYSMLYPMIEGGTDCQWDRVDGYDPYLTPRVSYSNMSKSQVEEVCNLILYDTPEFYFLDTLINISTVSGKNSGTVRLEVYDDFAMGSDRAAAASKIKNKINWYLNQVNPNDSAYDREKKIHNLLVMNCSYDGYANYSQSCASVFLNSRGATVCAGYSEAFALLCYASGIPAYSVTSDSHEWNQAKIDGYWYNVDVTWDDDDADRESEIAYDYFDISDKTLLRNDREAHTLESFWDKIGREACPYDYGDAPAPVYPTVYKGIDYADVYDFEYYVNAYSDVKNAFGKNANSALAHFVNFGMQEGRQAKESFSVQSYRNEYADLRAAFGWNNLVAYYNHYLFNGVREGRHGTGCNTLQNPIHVLFNVDFSPVYDYYYYNSHYPDLAYAFGGDDMSLLIHFLSHGIYEGRQASANFNLMTYINNNEDLRNAFGWDILSYIIHYINFGQYEGRVAV